MKYRTGAWLRSQHWRVSYIKVAVEAMKTNEGRREHLKTSLWRMSSTFGWKKIAFKKRRKGQRSRRETDICSVTSQGKRNIKGREGKINSDEFSKK